MDGAEKLRRARQYAEIVAEAEDAAERAYYGLRQRGDAQGIGNASFDGDGLYRQVAAHDRAARDLAHKRATLARYRREAAAIASSVGGTKGEFMRLRYVEGQSMSAIRRRMRVGRATLYRWRHEIEG